MVINPAKKKPEEYKTVTLPEGTTVKLIRNAVGTIRFINVQLPKLDKKDLEQIETALKPSVQEDYTENYRSMVIPKRPVSEISIFEDISK